MKYLLKIALISAFVTNAYAYSSHECDIEKIEAGSDAILIYVDNCTLKSGDVATIPQGNGFTNDATGSQSYLWLAQTESEVALRSHMLSIALTSFAAAKRVVFRWDQDGSRGVISHLYTKK